MRKRNTYRAVWLNQVHVERLKEAVEGKYVTFAVDEAKEVPLGAVMTGVDEVKGLLKWKQPSETREVIELLGRLGAKRVRMVMEPSGTYGDALRAQAWAAGMEVHRVSSKRVHDLAEVHDGVPSHHDAKSTVIIGNLDLQGRSERWPLRSGKERDAVAAVKMMSWHQEQLQKGKGHLEAELARYWPELLELLELGSATQLALLKEYGSAQAVAADPKGAAKLIRKAGRGRVPEEKLVAILESALRTTGVEATELERLAMVQLCEETDRTRKLEEQARHRVHQLMGDEPMVQQMAKVVGETTAAVLYADMGDPRAFEKPAQYIKSIGLNLKEKSSGKYKGVVHITKRGNSRARQYLYLAVIRMLKECAVIRAWFERKRGRDGGKGKGGKGIVAIMRKLAAALWHVARGASFDPLKLYNVSLLGLEIADTVEAAPEA